MLGLLVGSEDGDYIFLKNLGLFSTNHTVLYPRK
jgi:hypothetical protein